VEATDLEDTCSRHLQLQKERTPKAIVAMMVARFREVFQPSLGCRVTERGLTSGATTLASMVEWETARPERDGLVASVFYNRLRLGMRCSAIRPSSTRSP